MGTTSVAGVCDTSISRVLVGAHPEVGDGIFGQWNPEGATAAVQRRTLSELAGRPEVTPPPSVESIIESTSGEAFVRALTRNRGTLGIRSPDKFRGVDEAFIVGPRRHDIPWAKVAGANSLSVRHPVWSP